MAAFEFKKKIIALEFPDVKIELEYNSELRRKLTQVGESLQTIGKEAEANPDAGIAYLKSGIDSICGDGACDKIIGGREVDLDDYVDILKYIIVEITNYTNKYMTQFSKYLKK